MAKHLVAGITHDDRVLVIEKWCREDGAVVLKRDKQNQYDDNAIGVFLNVKHLFGLFKSLRQIGFIKSTAAQKMAKKLDNGDNYTAKVESFYVADDKEFARVTIDVVFDKKTHVT